MIAVGRGGGFPLSYFPKRMRLVMKFENNRGEVRTGR